MLSLSLNKAIRDRLPMLKNQPSGFESFISQIFSILSPALYQSQDIDPKAFHNSLMNIDFLQNFEQSHNIALSIGSFLCDILPDLLQISNFLSNQNEASLTKLKTSLTTQTRSFIVIDELKISIDYKPLLLDQIEAILSQKKEKHIIENGQSENKASSQAFSLSPEQQNLQNDCYEILDVVNKIKAYLLLIDKTLPRTNILALDIYQARLIGCEIEWNPNTNRYDFYVSEPVLFFLNLVLFTIGDEFSEIREELKVLRVFLLAYIIIYDKYSINGANIIAYYRFEEKIFFKFDINNVVKELNKVLDYIIFSMNKDAKKKNIQLDLSSQVANIFTKDEIATLAKQLQKTTFINQIEPILEILGLKINIDNPDLLTQETIDGLRKNIEDISKGSNHRPRAIIKRSSNKQSFANSAYLNKVIADVSETMQELAVFTISEFYFPKLQKK
jgi:hypothetical protein